MLVKSNEIEWDVVNERSPNSTYPKEQVGIAQTIGDLEETLSKLSTKELQYIVLRLKQTQGKKLSPTEEETRNTPGLSELSGSKIDLLIEQLQNSSIKSLFNKFNEKSFTYGIDYNLKTKSPEEEFDRDGIYSLKELQKIAEYIEANPKEFVGQLGYSYDTDIPYKLLSDELRDGSKGTIFWFGTNVVIDENEKIYYPFCHITKEDNKLSVEIYWSNHFNMFYNEYKLPTITIKRPGNTKVNPWRIESKK